MAAARPESDKKKRAVRPLDRKAYDAGRDVIGKIQDKLDHELVPHRGHLKRVSECESGFWNVPVGRREGGRGQ